MTLKQGITIALGLFLLYLLFTIGFPFLLAIVIVMFLDPLIILLMKTTKMNRISASTIVCTLFTLTSLWFIYWSSSKLLTELIQLFRNAPDYINSAYTYFSNLSNSSNSFTDALSPEVMDQVNASMSSSLDTVLRSLQGTVSKLPDTLLNLVSFIPNALVVYVVFTVALYLFSYSLPSMKNSFLSLFDIETRDQVNVVLQNLRDSIFGFLRAQLTLSLLTYIVTVIGLLILDVRFAFAIGLLIILVDILPILGTGSILIPWALYEWLVKSDVKTGVGLIILFLFIMIFRRVLEPKILGDAIGIGALAALISMFIGYETIGLIGLIMGPIVIIIYEAMKKEGLLAISIKFK
jgi:sporulation integral membrane protein YtvI